jgi:hypothetical protein
MTMLVIDPNFAQKYETLLVQQDIPINQRSNFYKWLRYYLDFCDKYQMESSEKRNFSAFEEKLRTKNQSITQRQQAVRFPLESCHSKIWIEWLLWVGWRDCDLVKNITTLNGRY